jgi:hypothetical protein
MNFYKTYIFLNKVNSPCFLLHHNNIMDKDNKVFLLVGLYCYWHTFHILTNFDKENIYKNIFYILFNLFQNSRVNMGKKAVKLYCFQKNMFSKKGIQYMFNIWNSIGDNNIHFKLNKTHFNKYNNCGNLKFYYLKIYRLHRINHLDMFHKIIQAYKVNKF